MMLKKGSRVRCICSDPNADYNSEGPQQGMMGTIIVVNKNDENDYNYGVEWDMDELYLECNGLHNLEGAIDNGRGWFCKPNMLMTLSWKDRYK